MQVQVERSLLLMQLSTNIWKTSVKWAQGPPPPGAGRADVSVKEQLPEKPGNSINRTCPSSTHSLPSERPSRSPAGQTADSRERGEPLPSPAKVFGTWHREVIRTLTIMLALAKRLPGRQAPPAGASASCVLPQGQRRPPHSLPLAARSPSPRKEASVFTCPLTAWTSQRTSVGHGAGSVATRGAAVLAGVLCTEGSLV